jgi:glycosyltransferase involved in cell wall biosynthesis
MFKIVSVGGPAEGYVCKCLDSVLQQENKDWVLQMVLDPAGDKTYEQAKKYESSQIHIKLNLDRRYALANIVDSIKLLDPTDEDILVFLDADDWLSGPRALSIVKSYYDKHPSLLVTHGSWTSHPNPKVIHNNAPYERREFNNGLRHGPWRGSHLRTMKYKVWKRIKDTDLRDKNGMYYPSGWDLAIMFPALEMAGYDRVAFIADRIYVYNQETPHNDHKVRSRQQTDYANYIRSQKPYQLLGNV